MKALAIGDRFIPAGVLEAGLEALKAKGVRVTAREWRHASLEELQRDNLLVEQGGPDAVKPPDDLTADIEGADLLIVQFFPVGKELISRARGLKSIGVLRAGTENVACDFAAGRGIEVINTPGRNARAVAEFTVALIFAEIRNIGRSHAALRQAVWRKDFPNSAAIPEIHGKTVGIVGYGNIGRMVAGYLLAFGARIVFYDPFATGDAGSATSVSLAELLRASDIVSLNLRLSEETYHLIGAEELALMKPSAVLVNTSRSGVIDQAALVEALRSRRIMGAALDVFDLEPLPADDPLLRLDNVTLTAHMAGSTIDAFANSPRLFADRYLAMHPELFA
jgi:D-3-phosphoglycerate dehydrogenase / 2-oxoglutarate reductase